MEKEQKNGIEKIDVTKISLRTLLRSCELCHFRNRLQSKIQKYFSNKGNSRLSITLRFIFFSLKLLFYLRISYKSKYTDNVCHVLIRPGGGVGDHLFFLKYCYCLKKKFQETIKIDVILHKLDSYLKYLYEHISFIDFIFENNAPNHDVYMQLTRFPEIQNIDVERIGLVCSKKLIDFWFHIAQFQQEYNNLYLSDFLGKCFSTIYSRTRENQADVYNMLDMSSTADFRFTIDEKVVRDTLSKFKLVANGYVLLQTGSGHFFQNIKNDVRQWPIEYYERLVTLLKRKYSDIKFVQCGESYQNHIKNVDIDLVGKTTLDESFSIIKCAKLLISAEGGYPIIRHFVSRKKSCVLFGPTSQDFFGFNENINISANVCSGCEWITKTWHKNCIISGNQPYCMKNLLPEKVANCIESEHAL